MTSVTVQACYASIAILLCISFHSVDGGVFAGETMHGMQPAKHSQRRGESLAPRSSLLRLRGGQEAKGVNVIGSKEEFDTAISTKEM
jgi:hypothetical protein